MFAKKDPDSCTWDLFSQFQADYGLSGRRMALPRLVGLEIKIAGIRRGCPVAKLPAAIATVAEIRFTAALRTKCLDQLIYHFAIEYLLPILYRVLSKRNGDKAAPPGFQHPA